MKQFLVSLYSEQVQKGTKIYYHFFPEFECTQEANSAWVKQVSGMTMWLVPQFDGSRLRVVSPSVQERASVRSLCFVLGELTPYKDADFIPEGDTEFVKTLVGVSLAVDRYQMMVYRFQAYENGFRYIPVLFDKQSQECWNVASLFLRNIPEDELGVFFTSDDAMLKVCREMFQIEVDLVDYLPAVRLCPSCKRTYNSSEPPPKRQWVNTRWRQLETDQITKGRDKV